LTGGKTVTAAEIQSLLDDETALVEYSLDKGRSFAWVVTNNSIRATELQGEAAITQTVKALGTSFVDSQVDSVPAARKLSQLIIAPIDLPHHIRRLAIVAEGPLESVPFAVLPSGDGRPLLSSLEIVRLPSASVLAGLRRERSSRAAAPKGIFIVADPVFNKDD